MTHSLKLSGGYKMTAAIVPKKLLLCMVIVVLSACSTGPRQGSKPPQQSNEDTNFIEVPLREHQRSASSWLANARMLTGSEQVDALLQAAATFQRDQQWQQSAVVIAQVQRHFEAVALTRAQQQLLALLEARFAAHEGRWTYAEQLLKPLLTPRLSADYPEQTLELALQAARVQSHWQEAAAYQLQLVNIAPEHSEPEAVWEVLKHVTQPTTVALPPASQRTQLVAGWVQLMTTLHAIANEPSRFEHHVTQWQQSFGDHPGHVVLTRLTDMTENPRNNILVLLPLTGQYEEQGTAVRDGMIKALTRLPQLNAIFLDTNQLDMAALPELLQQYQANMLLGPLLKPNVAAVDTRLLPEGLPWLTLNEPEHELVLTHAAQHFFALDAETEIRQAASYMATQGHRHPIVLAPANNRGQQQAELFKQAWEAQFPDQVKVALG